MGELQKKSNMCVYIYIQLDIYIYIDLFLVALASDLSLFWIISVMFPNMAMAKSLLTPKIDN